MKMMNKVCALVLSVALCAGMAAPAFAYGGEPVEEVEQPVLTSTTDEEDVVTALKRGADGYLLKDMEPEDLLKALHQAAAGEMVLSEALTPVLAASLRANRATTERDVNQLTPRERDILKLIAQGLPNKMIARRLDITESTVKVHVKHMLKKMKLKSRVEAAVWVHQERIF